MDHIFQLPWGAIHFKYILAGLVGISCLFHPATSYSDPGYFMLPKSLHDISWNPLGLDGAKHPQFGVGYRNKYRVGDYSESLVGFSFPLPESLISGISFSRFGSAIYAVDNAVVNCFKELGSGWSGGVGLRYHSFRYGNGYGTTSRFSTVIALKFSVTSFADAAVMITDPFSNSSDGHEIRNTKMYGGLLVRSGKVKFSITVCTPSNQKSVLSLDVQYEPTPRLKIYTGISTQTRMVSFGLNIIVKRLNVDLRSSYHMILGYSPQISLVWKLKK